MKKIIIFSTLLGLKLFLISNSASAAPSGETIARQGNGNGALACTTCHGEQGQGNAAAGYPYLAGQPVEYLVKQLQDFTRQRRKDPVMQPFASALSEDEIKAVAGYYAKLPLPKTASGSKDRTQLSQGEQLATKGKWSVGVPACFQCHGEQGQGIAPDFPAISGQPAFYTRKQLEHWRKGERSNDAVGLMQAVVADLDDTEITAVSHYLAAQSPVNAQ
ncbi:MAG: c-type cytochrome [Gammaproteobacteria bacterium]|jgi:thiosulfate dehydrogenase